MTETNLSPFDIYKTHFLVTSQSYVNLIIEADSKDLHKIIKDAVSDTKLIPFEEVKLYYLAFLKGCGKVDAMTSLMKSLSRKNAVKVKDLYKMNFSSEQTLNLVRSLPENSKVALMQSWIDDKFEAHYDLIAAVFAICTNEPSGSMFLGPRLDTLDISYEPEPEMSEAIMSDCCKNIKTICEGKENSKLGLWKKLINILQTQEKYAGKIEAKLLLKSTAKELLTAINSNEICQVQGLDYQILLGVADQLSIVISDI